MTDDDSHREQLQTDAHFLSSHPRMDADLVEVLVLQLNRIHPQILSDKEAHRFRKLSVPSQVRLAELLKHLDRKGEAACQELYRGLQLHAEDVYASLPTRVTRREMSDPTWSFNTVTNPERRVLNDRGPLFFLRCLSLAAGAAMLYYYREGGAMRGTGPVLHCSAATFSKDVLVSYADVRKQREQL